MYNGHRLGDSSLNVQIAFLAPKNLETWAFLSLGLRSCSRPRKNPISFPRTSAFLGYVVNEQEKTTSTYQNLQEFVSYITNRDFKNPRLADLSDLHPAHPFAMDLSAAGIYIDRVKVSPDASGFRSKIGYVLTPKHEESSSNLGWILVIFEATTVLQIVRNLWDTSSMEDLVRHLVRHGIQFRTLVPASQVTLDSILLLNEASIDFTTIPPMNHPKRKLSSADYARYVELRQQIIRSPHGRAAFRMGGILWRLAMESKENFDNVINEIMEGPSELGPARGECFYVEGDRYYDLVVRSSVADTICGVHGLETGQHNTPGCSYWPTVAAWSKRRWSSAASSHENLMWTHRDEEWYQKRVGECVTAGVHGQPRSQANWKHQGTNKHKFDVPFEDYCATFLESALQS